MPRWSRRAFLGTGAAVATGLAGCVGGPRGYVRGGSSDGGVVLDTLAVGGSPGTRVAVAPAGSVVLLDFFATWCAPCKPQMASLRAVHATFPDVHLLSITAERERDLVEAFWREYGGTWPVALDPDLRATEAFRVTGIPTLVVLDPGGREAWRHVGLAARDDLEDALRDAGA